MPTHRVYLMHLLRESKTIASGGLVLWPRGFLLGGRRIRFVCEIQADASLKCVDPAIHASKLNNFPLWAAPSSMMRAVIASISGAHTTTNINSWAVLRYVCPADASRMLACLRDEEKMIATNSEILQRSPTLDELRKAYVAERQEIPHLQIIKDGGVKRLRPSSSTDEDRQRIERLERLLLNRFGEDEDDEEGVICEIELGAYGKRVSHLTSRIDSEGRLKCVLEHFGGQDVTDDFIRGLCVAFESVGACGSLPNSFRPLLSFVQQHWQVERARWDEITGQSASIAVVVMRSITDSSTVGLVATRKFAVGERISAFHGYRLADDVNSRIHDGYQFGMRVIAGDRTYQCRYAKPLADGTYVYGAASLVIPDNVAALAEFSSRYSNAQFEKASFVGNPAEIPLVATKPIDAGDYIFVSDTAHRRPSGLEAVKEHVRVEII